MKSACPDENALAKVVDGSASGEERTSLEGHIDACEPCAELVAALARTWFDGAETRAPTVLGRYEMGARIGEGGMGAVYAARDPVLERTVALKVIARGDADEARLLREARAMARVAHANVVSVHDAGRGEHGEVFIAMDLVRGPSLRRWLALHPDAPWRGVLALLLGAARGLEAAHAAGVVHRDFKPENVLVEPGDPPRAKVTDFGLARPFVAAAAAASDAPPSSAGRAAWLEDHTRSSGVRGTPAYMAPEILAGVPGDARADQFAFGLTLYEALYRARPFPRGATMSDRREAVERGPASPPAGALAGVPLWLLPIIRRTLRARPEDRFSSMSAVIAALERGEGASAEWLLALHVLMLVAMSFAHAMITLLVVLGATTPDDPTDVSTPGTLERILSWWLGLLVLSGIGPAGIPVTALGAWGMAKRKRWAYALTSIYAAIAAFTCVGTPYAIFAALTLPRADVRTALGRRKGI